MTYDAVWALAREAARRFTPAPGLPAFFALTDPQRTPDPVALARRLPRGSGLVLRHFGEPGQIALAGPLSRIARERGLVFLIAGDPVLARSVKAHGVHWPQRQAHRAPVWARRRPDWLMTASAHDRAAVHRPARGIEAVFLSPVFESTSPSATTALGPVRAARLAREARVAVYALGGVNTTTLPALGIRVFSGVCAVSARPSSA